MSSYFRRSALWSAILANLLSSIAFVIAYALSANLWLLLPAGIFAVAALALFLLEQQFARRAERAP
jgi:hypothetical protein